MGRRVLVIGVVALLALALPSLASAKVETKWLMDGEHLSEDGEFTLSGNFAFSGSVGSAACAVTAKFRLMSGEVEEEPEGEVETFSVNEPEKCDVGGTVGSVCGTHSVSGVEKTGTWNLTTNEEEITIPEVVLLYKFAGCAIPSLRLKGSVTLFLYIPTSVAEVSYDGEPSIYNAEEENLGTVKLNGFQSVSPRRTYGVTPCGGGGSPFPLEWTHEGDRLPKACIEEFSGQIPVLISLIGAIYCDVHLVAEVMGPSGSSIPELNVTIEACEGTGMLTKCIVSESKLVSQPSIGTEEESFYISGLRIDSSFENCAFSEAPSLAETLIATPDNPTAISFVNLAGSFNFGFEFEFEAEFKAAHPETFGLA